MSNGNSTVKVLIVDDDKLIADTLAVILGREGFEARALYSAESAIEVVAHFSPDILLFDVVMPGRTCLDAAIHLQRELPHCKMLLFSGKAATTDLLSMARARGYHFEILEKPIHPTELLAALRT